MFEKFFVNFSFFVKECGYQDQENMILDVIVFGIQDYKVYEKCIGEGLDLILEKIINFVCICEIFMQ